MVHVEVRRLADMATYEPLHHNGTVNRLIVGPADNGGSLSIVHGTIAPDGSAHPHWHAKSDQIIHVLSGECRVDTDRTDVLAAGDTVIVPTGVQHRVTPVGGTELRLLIVYSPALTPDDTFTP